MSVIDLSSYQSIHTALFVKITVDTYGDILFSNYFKEYTIGSDTYNSLGSIMGVTSPAVELSATNKQITITLSGLPTANRSIVQDYNIKGSPVTITRGFFDSTTGLLLPVTGNPAVRFKGIITNFAMQEDWDSNAQTSSNTIQFDCASNLGLFRDKRGGRRTNPSDFPTDLSFDRIPQLSQSNFNFGGKVKR